MNVNSIKEINIVYGIIIIGQIVIIQIIKITKIHKLPQQKPFIETKSSNPPKKTIKTNPKMSIIKAKQQIAINISSVHTFNHSSGNYCLRIYVEEIDGVIDMKKQYEERYQGIEGWNGGNGNADGGIDVGVYAGRYGELGVKGKGKGRDGAWRDKMHVAYAVPISAISYSQSASSSSQFAPLTTHPPSLQIFQPMYITKPFLLKPNLETRICQLAVFKHEINIFSSKYQNNFHEITYRIVGELVQIDGGWYGNGNAEGRKGDKAENDSRYWGKIVGVFDGRIRGAGIDDCLWMDFYDGVACRVIGSIHSCVYQFQYQYVGGPVMYAIGGKGNINQEKNRENKNSINNNGSKNTNTKHIQKPSKISPINILTNIQPTLVPSLTFQMYCNMHTPQYIQSLSQYLISELKKSHQKILLNLSLFQPIPSPIPAISSVPPTSTSSSSQPLSKQSPLTLTLQPIQQPISILQSLSKSIREQKQIDIRAKTDREGMERLSLIRGKYSQEDGIIIENLGKLGIGQQQQQQQYEQQQQIIVSDDDTLIIPQNSTNSNNSNNTTTIQLSQEYEHIQQQSKISNNNNNRKLNDNPNPNAKGNQNISDSVVIERQLFRPYAEMDCGQNFTDQQYHQQDDDEIILEQDMDTIQQTNPNSNFNYNSNSNKSNNLHNNNIQISKQLFPPQTQIDQNEQNNQIKKTIKNKQSNHDSARNANANNINIHIHMQHATPMPVHINLFDNKSNYGNGNGNGNAGKNGRIFQLGNKCYGNGNGSGNNNSNSLIDYNSIDVKIDRQYQNRQKQTQIEREENGDGSGDKGKKRRKIFVHTAHNQGNCAIGTNNILQFKAKIKRQHSQHQLFSKQKLRPQQQHCQNNKFLQLPDLQMSVQSSAYSSRQIPTTQPHHHPNTNQPHQPQNYKQNSETSLQQQLHKKSLQIYTNWRIFLTNLSSPSSSSSSSTNNKISNILHIYRKNYLQKYQQFISQSIIKFKGSIDVDLYVGEEALRNKMIMQIRERLGRGKGTGNGNGSGGYGDQFGFWDKGLFCARTVMFWEYCVIEGCGGNEKVKLQPKQQKRSFLKLSKSPSLSTSSSPIHLIFLVHGLGACRIDMQKLKIQLKRAYETQSYSPSSSSPHSEPQQIHIIASSSNESRTEGDIDQMGIRFACQVDGYINKYWEPDQYDNHVQGQRMRVSFIGHSMGGIIIRSALPRLEKWKDFFYSYVSLSSPHIGYNYSSSRLIDVGLWLINNWHKCQSILQLTMSDNPNPHQTFLYKLSLQPGLEWFSRITLFGSRQDLYVPYFSARIQKPQPDSQLNGNIYGKLHGQMVDNIIKRITTPSSSFPSSSHSHRQKQKILRRVDVNFCILQQNIDNLIGRAAHICFVGNRDFMRLVCNMDDNIVR